MICSTFSGGSELLNSRSVDWNPPTSEPVAESCVGELDHQVFDRLRRDRAESGHGLGKHADFVFVHLLQQLRRFRLADARA